MFKFIITNRLIFRAIALAVICIFLVNDIALGVIYSVNNLRSATLAPPLRSANYEFHNSFSAAQICDYIERGMRLNPEFGLKDVLAKINIGGYPNVTALKHEVLVDIPSEGLAIRYFEPSNAIDITPYADVRSIRTVEICPMLKRQVVRRIKAIEAPVNVGISQIAETEEQVPAALIGNAYYGLRVSDIIMDESAELCRGAKAKLMISAINVITNTNESFRLSASYFGTLNGDIGNDIIAAANPDHRRLVAIFVDSFRLDLPLWIINDNIEGLSGFSSTGKHNLIALYKELAHNPVAQFHEYMHHCIEDEDSDHKIRLVKKGTHITVFMGKHVLDIDVTDGLISLNRTGESWVSLSDNLLNSNMYRHYLIRILQRELFGINDQILTWCIRRIQRGNPIDMSVYNDLHGNSMDDLHSAVIATRFLLDQKLFPYLTGIVDNSILLANRLSSVDCEPTLLESNGSNQIYAAEGVDSVDYVPTVESHMLGMINAVACAVLCARKFRPTNRNSFMDILTDNEVVEKLRMLAMSPSIRDLIKATIKVGRKERYGVPRAFIEGEDFGDGETELDFGVVPVDGLPHQSKSLLGTTLFGTERGGLRNIPDELLMSTCIIRKPAEGRRLKAGPVPMLSLDKPPDRESLQKIADYLDKDITDIKIIVPIGERHMSDDPDSLEADRYLINALMKAGIKYDTDDYEIISRQVERDGYYENGNIMIVMEIFPEALSIIEGKSDIILGSAVPTNIAQTAFALKASGNANAIFRFESFQKMRDRRREGDVRPNLYGDRTPTDIDLGIMRRYGIFSDTIAVDKESGQLSWSDILSVDDIIPGNDGAMIYACARSREGWISGMNAPVFSEDMSEVTFSILWIGLSGDVKVVKVPYKTIIGDMIGEIKELENHGNKTNLLQDAYFRLAQSYLEFGNLKKARDAIKKSNPERWWERYVPDNIFSVRVWDRPELIDVEIRYGLLSIYIDVLIELTSRKKSEWTSQEGLIRPDSFLRFHEKLQKKLKFISGFSKDMPGEVRRIFPPMATLLKKMHQQTGDHYRGEAMNILGEADKIFEDINAINTKAEPEKDGTDELLMKKLELELKARYRNARKLLEASKNEYEAALRYFPEQKGRTPRHRFEYELYKCLMDLVGHLLDFSGRHGSPATMQPYYNRLAEYYRDLADIHERGGYDRKSIYFIRESSKEYRKLYYRGISGPANIQVRIKIPDIYSDMGWYEAARSEYLRLSDERFLLRLNQGLSIELRDFSFFLTSGFSMKCLINYLVTDYLCGCAINIEDAEEARGRMAQYYWDRYKEFEIRADGIYALPNGQSKDQAWVLIKEMDVDLERVQSVLFESSDIELDHRQCIIYRHTDLSLLIKEIKDVFFEKLTDRKKTKKQLLATYNHAAISLGGLIAPFRIVKDLDIRVEERGIIVSKHIADAILVQKVKSYDLRDQLRIAARKDDIARMKDYIKRMFYVDRHIMRRGFFLPAMNFKNFGVMEDGSVVLIDPGSLIVVPENRELELRGNNHVDNIHILRRLFDEGLITAEQRDELEEYYSLCSGISVEKLNNALIGESTKRGRKSMVIYHEAIGRADYLHKYIQSGSEDLREVVLHPAGEFTPAGAFKNLGPRLSAITMEGIRSKEPEWNNMAEMESINNYTFNINDEKGNKEKITLRAKIAYIPDGDTDIELPKEINAWALGKEGDPAQDGYMLLAVRAPPEAENVSFLNELLYHEYRELCWHEEGLSRREAHIMASAEQSRAFSNGSKPTPYHRAQIGNMTTYELVRLLEENPEARNKHYEIVEFFDDDLFGFYKYYERAVRKYAISVYSKQETDASLVRNVMINYALECLVLAETSEEMKKALVVLKKYKAGEKLLEKIEEKIDKAMEAEEDKSRSIDIATLIERIDYAIKDRDIVGAMEALDALTKYEASGDIIEVARTRIRIYLEEVITALERQLSRSRSKSTIIGIQKKLAYTKAQHSLVAMTATVKESALEEPPQEDGEEEPLAEVVENGDFIAEQEVKFLIRHYADYLLSRAETIGEVFLIKKRLEELAAGKAIMLKVDYRMIQLARLRYFDWNEGLLKKLFGEGEPNILVRVPIEYVKSVDSDKVKWFLETLQKRNGYLELYHTSGITEVSSGEYRQLGLEKKPLPEDKSLDPGNRTRENTLTLFLAGKDEDLTSFSESDIYSRLGSIYANPKNTILLPVGLENDVVGLERAINLGLSIIDVARQIARARRAGNDIAEDRTFKDSVQAMILEQVKSLFDQDMLISVNLKSDDVIALAVGNTNQIISAIKKLIKLLPAVPIDVAEQRQIRERAKAVLDKA